jgi:hypothetical protein
MSPYGSFGCEGGSFDFNVSGDVIVVKRKQGGYRMDVLKAYQSQFSSLGRKRPVDLQSLSADANGHVALIDENTPDAPIQYPDSLGPILINELKFY